MQVMLLGMLTFLLMSYLYSTKRCANAVVGRGYKFTSKIYNQLSHSVCGNQ